MIIGLQGSINEEFDSMKIKNFLKEELKGWKKLEVLWLLIACIVIAGLSIYWHDSVMGIISATTGVACVVCTGKGKLSAYVLETMPENGARITESARSSFALRYSASATSRSRFFLSKSAAAMMFLR